MGHRDGVRWRAWAGGGDAALAMARAIYMLTPLTLLNTQYTYHYPPASRTTRHPGHSSCRCPSQRVPSLRGIGGHQAWLGGGWLLGPWWGRPHTLAIWHLLHRKRMCTHLLPLLIPLFPRPTPAPEVRRRQRRGRRWMVANPGLTSHPRLAGPGAACVATQNGPHPTPA